MTPHTITIVGLLLLSGLPVAGRAQQVTVEVTNPLRERRPSETVEISWATLVAAEPRLSLGMAAVFDGVKRLDRQLLDVDADGVPDQLLFQADLEPSETRTFTITQGGTLASPSVVDARFVLPRQDMAWENDRIAFRIYGSRLAGNVDNGIDVWTKRVRYPVIKKWYDSSAARTDGKDSYHEDRGEGADFFSVGRSLGAGSCGILHNGVLVQPGLFSSHRVITTGPIRAMFEVTYDSGSIGGQRYRAVTRVSIDAGQNLSRISVSYSGCENLGPFVIAAGLVKRKNTACSLDPKTPWIALWGRTNDDPLNGELGTGIVVPFKLFRSVQEDSVHVLILADPGKEHRLTYWAGAGWTRSGDFADAAQWASYLAAFSRRVESPVKVSVLPARK